MASSSPLFARASREIQQAARTSLDRTALGQLARELRTAQNAGTAKFSRLEKALLTYQRGGSAEVLRQLRGTGFGQFAQEIAKYSRQPSLRVLLQQFLGGLGPTGKLIKALADYGSSPTKDSVEAIAALARAYGMETLLPPALRGKFQSLDKRGIQAAIKRLQDEGYTVVGPGERVPDLPAAPMPGGGVQQQVAPKGFERHPMGGEGITRQVTGYGNLPPNHPLLTGDMVPAPGSSNVHSFGYDIDTSTLYIRYLGGSANQQGKKTQPGSLYAYHRVPPRIFLAMMDAASKGTFVWDEIRIRGTLSQHHYPDYELVGIVDGYVPRQAQAYFDSEKNRIVEGWFKRRITGSSGRTYQSAYANVGEVDVNTLPAHFRGLDRGHQPWSPLRGTPQRPDDGQGYRR